jgi:hypothetical protein
MILCLANDYRYFINVKHLAYQGELLHINQCYDDEAFGPNANLQKDWNLYPEGIFNFVVLYVGEDWRDKSTRLTMPGGKLIAQNSERCYNIFESYELRVADLNPFYQKRHSEKTKLLMSSIKKGIPNDALGAKVSIDAGQSIAQASRELGHSRKLIRTRINSADPTGNILE